MKIHIRAISFHEAARLVRDQILTHGGKWVVWHDASYNYLMAPSGSSVASGVRKYWKEVVAGEFDKDFDRFAMRSMMESAYYGGGHMSKAKHTEVRKRQIREYNRLYMREMRAKKKLDAAYGQKVAA